MRVEATLGFATAAVVSNAMVVGATLDQSFNGGHRGAHAGHRPGRSDDAVPPRLSDDDPDRGLRYWSGSPDCGACAPAAGRRRRRVGMGMVATVGAG